ncbi:MAG TPA: hypothetical protein ENN43_00840 [bacterium]|nr:hypothetical protein [bacterium]
MKQAKLINLTVNKPMPVHVILEMLETWIVIYEDSRICGKNALAKKNMAGLARVASLLDSPFIRTKTNADRLLRRAAEMAAQAGHEEIEEIGAFIYSASEIIRESN